VIEYLKHKLQKEDSLVRTQVGNLRVASLRATNALHEGARRWQMKPAAAEVFGNAMASTLLYGSLFKDEERIKCELSGKGGLESVYVEAISSLGEVRGNVRNPGFVPPKDNSGNSASWVGNGSLKVTKILVNRSDQFVTTVESNGDVVTAWSRYFLQSEQIPTLVRVVTVLDSRYNKHFCGGFLAQALPPASSSISQLSSASHLSASVPPLLLNQNKLLTGTGQQQIDNLKEFFDSNASWSLNMRNIMTSRGVLAYIADIFGLVNEFRLKRDPLIEVRQRSKDENEAQLRDAKAALQFGQQMSFTRVPVAFICRCANSKDHDLAAMLISGFSPGELESLLTQAQRGGNNVELSCTFCNTKHRVAPSAVRDFIAKQNATTDSAASSVAT
jgi:redox-regulated HSP33 family molecular chaperone